MAKLHHCTVPDSFGVEQLNHFTQLLWAIIRNVNLILQSFQPKFVTLSILIIYRNFVSFGASLFAFKFYLSGIWFILENHKFHCSTITRRRVAKINYEKCFVQSICITRPTTKRQLQLMWLAFSRYLIFG